MTFEEIFDKYWEFAEKTFDTKASDSLKGLLREVHELSYWSNNELITNIDDELEEISDILFYTMYYLKRRLYMYDEIKEAMLNKLEVLKTRKWKKDETGCYSHVKQQCSICVGTGLIDKNNMTDFIECNKCKGTGVI